MELAAVSRSVPEWVGRTEDTAVPARVRLRVWQREDGRCHRCGRKIGAAEAWVLEHLKALVNGGRNAESNLALSCPWCVPAKNAEDVAEKSRVATLAKKHFGLVKPKGDWGAGRNTKWKQKIGGRVVPRTEDA